MPPHVAGCKCGRCGRTGPSGLAIGTLHFEPLQRRQVVTGHKTAHLYPVRRSGEAPFRRSEVRALWRPPRDLDLKDAKGEWIHREKDGSPKPELDACHVQILTVAEVPLGDLVKADADAMGFGKIADLARWWMDERRPSWRNAFAAGDHITTEQVLKLWQQWQTRTAWLVTWERVPEASRFLRPGYGWGGADTLRAGASITDYEQRKKSDAARERELKKAADARKERAENAKAFADRIAQRDVGTALTGAERRRARSQHRRLVHDLAAVVRDLERIA
ncbi:MAG: hypothetical protein PGN13_16505 [Patulibacter minatonensis]